MKEINNKGFSFIGIIIAVAILVALTAMSVSNMGLGGVSGEGSVESTAEIKTVASTVYNVGKRYIDTQISTGVQLQPNGTIPSSALTGGLDTSNYEVIEVKLDDTGKAIKYVYVETKDGLKCDYPVGSSGKVN